MDGNQPPELPPPIDVSPLLPDASSLTRLTTEALSAVGDAREPEGPLPLADWRARMPDVDEPRALLRLRARGGSDALAAAAVITEDHAPEHGVATDGDDLLLVLPEGVGWATVAATAAACGGAGFVAGLADFGVDGQSLEDAIELSARAADAASEGGVDFAVRSRRDTEREARAEAIVAALECSLASGEGLFLVFQPKFDARTRTMVGAEALVRHRSDELGTLGPAEFLPVAARAGLSAEVERWVVGAAIDAIARWSRAGQLAFPISINVAPKIVFADGFVGELAEGIERAAIDPALLRLEISEAGVLADVERSVERLGELRALGVSVALDDFGGEDSPGLADLRRLPIDVLKVHRSFVLGMQADPGLAALVRGVVGLAAALGIETVAAGVETEAQLAELARLGCTSVQGFLLSEPLGPEAFGERLAREGMRRAG